MFARFEQLLKDKNPRFICTPVGGGAVATPEHIAHIDHAVTPGLDEESMTELRRQIPGLPTLWAFYTRYGSARLFRDLIAAEDGFRDSAYYIGSPEEWARLREDANDWFDQLDEGEREEMLPDWLSDYIVIGEVERAATYFLIPLVGDDKGKVIEFDHDGYEFTVRAESFEEFIESLAGTGPEHLAHMVGHATYCDGTTIIQWVPRKYLAD